tara:strand:- start:1883 stop:2023 length:141 start_codon:yes stop_codon:yes gene_type:complete
MLLIPWSPPLLIFIILLGCKRRKLMGEPRCALKRKPLGALSKMLEK